MADIKAFLMDNAFKTKSRHICVSERFKDDDGETIMWEIAPITERENEEIKRLSGFFDGCGKDSIEKYISRLCVKCVKYPDLEDISLQENYGVFGAETLVKSMLYAGEYANLVKEIRDINGFDKKLEDLKEEAKN